MGRLLRLHVVLFEPLLGEALLGGVRAGGAQKTGEGSELWLSNGTRPHIINQAKAEAMGGAHCRQLLPVASVGIHCRL